MRNLVRLAPSTLVKKFLRNLLMRRFTLSQDRHAKLLEHITSPASEYGFKMSVQNGNPLLKMALLSLALYSVIDRRY